MWVEKGTSPRHPDGKVDNTHTNVAGARKIVELLLPAITDVIPELKPHVLNYDLSWRKTAAEIFLQCRRLWMPLLTTASRMRLPSI